MSRFILYFIPYILAFGLRANAQPVKTVTLASPFSYTLKQDANQQAPAEGGNLGPFEILKVTPGANGIELLLVAYDTGTFNLALPGQEVAISVMAPTPESIKEYAPPKEPLFVRPEAKFPLWIPIAVTAVVLVLGLIYWLYRRKKAAPVPFAVQTPGGMSLLQEIKENWMAGKLSSLQLGEGLVNSLQAQFGMQIKKSTRQLVREMRHHFPEATNPELETVLEKTDAWRFGKQPAVAEEGQAAIRLIEGLFLFTTQKNINQNG